MQTLPMKTGYFPTPARASLSGAGCTSCSLGELSEEETLVIVTEHFDNLPMTRKIEIGTQVAQGNMKGISEEVKLIMKKVCVQGGAASVMDFFKKYWYFMLLLLGLGGIGYYFLFSPKSKRRKK